MSTVRSRRKSHKTSSPLPKLVKQRYFKRTRQRTNYTGAVHYVPRRPQHLTIGNIILACMRFNDPQSSTVNGDLLIHSFVSKLGVPEQEFWKLAFVDWRLHPEAGDQVHTWLKTIHFEGNIDDLWLSLYGIRKPSPPPIAGINTSKEVKKWLKSKSHQKVWHQFAGSGHTKKPGSHRS